MRMSDENHGTADGRTLEIASWALDTGGHYTQEAYGFARQHTQRGMAIKGANSADAPIIKRPTLQDVTWRGVPIKGGVKLWTIGVSRAKQILSRRLRIASPGPGCIHTPEGMSEDWYQQLCGERLVTRHTRGKALASWEKVRPSQRVEAWDCLVYAYAALARLGITAARWESLVAHAGRRRPAHHAAPTAPPRTPDEVEGPPARIVTPSSARPPGRKVTRSSWLKR